MSNKSTNNNCNSSSTTAHEVILISSESEDESSAFCGTTDPTNHNDNPVNGKTSSSDNKLNTCNAIVEVDVDHQFEKFINTCIPLIEAEANKDSSDIISFIKSRHNRVPTNFKLSPRYQNLLSRSTRKLTTVHGKKQAFVFINEVATVLGQHMERKKRKLTLAKAEVTPKKIELDESVISEKVANDDKTGPSQSESGEPSKDDIQAKIDKYESLLKRFGDEIKRLQAHELTLDEMNEEDSTYIQEAKLKRKALLIFQKLCAIKNVEPKTGRVTERRVALTSSRFPEINKKVESYVNRVKKFPDFYDIRYLVKRANDKHKLNLEKQEIENIAKNLFQEVGKRLQHVRHHDFILNFGSYLTDVATEKKLIDPAEENPELLATLQANRVKAKSALEEVINKFATQQEETKDAQPSTSKEVSGNEMEVGSDPPSESASTGSGSDASDSEDDADENLDANVSDVEVVDLIE